MNETRSDAAHDCRPVIPDGGWVAVSAAGENLLDAIAADPQGTLLATDVDGTLAPIVEDPAQAAVPDQGREALAALDGRLGSLAVITGRPVARAAEMLRAHRPGLEHLVLLGLYGNECYDPTSGQLQIPEPPAVVGRARRDLQDAVDRAIEENPELTGAMVEDKSSSVALHTRRARDREAAWQLLAPVARRLGKDLALTVEEGREVVELKAFRTSKADALNRLVAQHHPQVLVMCGDDLGDLPAMGVVQLWMDRGGSGARVVSYSAEQPQVAQTADVLCDGPAGVAALLAEIGARLT